MLDRSIAVVEVDHTFLNIVVAAFYDIASRTSRVILIVRIVGSIERIPINLGSVVIATGPEVGECSVGVEIDGVTD